MTLYSFFLLVIISRIWPVLTLSVFALPSIYINSRRVFAVSICPSWRQYVLWVLNPSSLKQVNNKWQLHYRVIYFTKRKKQNWAGQINLWECRHTSNKTLFKWAVHATDCKRLLWEQILLFDPRQIAREWRNVLLTKHWLWMNISLL